jgi:HAD superfamily hydrolase (TIGR01549 family)
MYIFDKFDFEGVKGILLDLDNTVYEYFPCHEKALQALYEEYYKIQPLSYSLFLDAYKEAQVAVKQRTQGQAANHSRLLYIQYMIEKFLKKSDTEKMLMLEEVYWNIFLNTMEVYKEVKNFLVECKKRGVIVCIITDLTASIQFRKIQRLELKGLFDFIVTSEEAGVEKPEAFIFSYALTKMGLQKNDVVMIGDDNKKDIDGARNYNIKALHTD